MDNLQTKLDRLSASSRPEGPALYLAACKLAVVRRRDLREQVFITVPPDGGRDWDIVRLATVPLCCDPAQRVFEPEEMRTKFRPDREIVLTEGQTRLLRPVGAPASAAYVEVAVSATPTGPWFVYVDDPAGADLEAALTSGDTSRPLRELGQLLGGESLLLSVDLIDHGTGVVRHKHIPVAVVTAVTATTVTLVLDQAVTAFDPAIETPHRH